MLSLSILFVAALLPLAFAAPDRPVFTLDCSPTGYPAACDTHWSASTRALPRSSSYTITALQLCVAVPVVVVETTSVRSPSTSSLHATFAVLSADVADICTTPKNLRQKSPTQRPRRPKRTIGAMCVPDSCKLHRVPIRYSGDWLWKQ